MTELPKASVLVRTWFGDDDAWESLVAEVRTPSDEGFLAYVTVVDDRAFDGLGADALRAAQVAPMVSFLADETTLSGAEHPVLAVWVVPRDDGYQPFRVVPAYMWSVENNINLANMDWDEFASAVDEDGVFRGFGPH